MSLSANRVFPLFGTVALLFAAALGWLGWRLIQQDRALARQRRLEQLEAAADRISAALYRRTAKLEEVLTDPIHAKLPEGAIVIQATEEGVQVRPADGLLYRPFVHAGREPEPTLFAAGEALEFQKEDPAAAAEAFRPLTRSADSATRAAALLRFGRSLAKAGRAPEALRAFDELCSMGTTPVSGLPAELVALEAKCSLFERLGHRSDLQREARILYDKLSRGCWRLSRASYDFKIGEARAWLGANCEPQSEDKAALSAAVETIWADWLREPVSRGRRFLPTPRGPIVEVWLSNPQELTALLAPAAAVWSPMQETGDFEARLIDAEGRLVFGPAGVSPAAHVDRSPASTKLPWTLQVSSSDDGSSGVASRQWVLACGLVLLLLLLGGASYLAARATSKELAVARLQTDFVSAVSHEFRSPLSSICQSPSCSMKTAGRLRSTGGAASRFSGARARDCGGWLKACSILRGWKPAPHTTAWSRSTPAISSDPRSRSSGRRRPGGATISICPPRRTCRRLMAIAKHLAEPFGIYWTMQSSTHPIPVRFRRT